MSDRVSLPVEVVQAVINLLEQLPHGQVRALYDAIRDNAQDVPEEKP